MPESQKPAEALPTHTPHLFEAAVRRAAEALRAGEIVAVPTETVYGLAANALDADAVRRIFEAKGRPSHNPLIVHVASELMAKQCAADWPDAATRLARAFWPGPLTLVLPKSGRVPDIVTAGGKTLGIRWPAHPFIQALIRECGFPLAAPSANLSNRISPTRPDHVLRQLAGRIRLVVDGGSCPVGIESTVLDLTVSPPRILRPGVIHDRAIGAVLGRKPEEAPEGGGTTTGDWALKSPGQLARHYAPQARLVVRSWGNDPELERMARDLGANPERTHVIAHSRIPSITAFGRVSVVPHDAEAFGRALYGELHACDEAGAEWIIVEAPPDGPEWRAVTDRLERAAHR